MRFMIMHKVTPEMEKGLPPEPAVIEGVGRLMTEATKAGIVQGGAGLKPTSTRMRITYKDGERTITDGPFAEAKELVAGFAQLKVKSKEEALAGCDKFAAAMGGNVELYLGPLVEVWDLGFGPKPENAPLRFLALNQATPASERDDMPDAGCMQRMGALVEEMTKAGILEATDGLLGSKKGVRLHFENGRRTVIDGPFAESKELVAGYAICKLPSLAAAIEFATKFGEVVKVHEIEIRQMPEWG